MCSKHHLCPLFNFVQGIICLSVVFLNVPLWVQRPSALRRSNPLGWNRKTVSLVFREVSASPGSLQGQLLLSLASILHSVALCGRVLGLGRGGSAVRWWCTGDRPRLVQECRLNSLSALPSFLRVYVCVHVWWFYFLFFCKHWRTEIWWCLWHIHACPGGVC